MVNINNQKRVLVKYEGNIAEYPFFLLSKREKSLCTLRKYLFGEGRSLIIENSYGIPTAFDADVLMALSYIGSQTDSLDKKIHFTIKELAEIMGCKDRQRVKKSIICLLRTIYTSEGTILTKTGNKNIYLDHTMIFHIVDTASLIDTQKKIICNSEKVREKTWVKFNEYFINNFISNYVQYINIEVYLALKTPTAKRLYIYLEKKQGGNDCFTIGIRKLAAVIPIEAKDIHNVRRLLREACKHLIDLNVIKNYYFENDNITFEFPVKPKKIIQENKQLSLSSPEPLKTEQTKEYLKQLVNPSFGTMTFALEQIKLKCPKFKGTSNFVEQHSPSVVLEKLAYGIYTHVFSHPIENLGGWLRTALKENFLSPEGFYQFLNENEANNETMLFENIKSEKVQKFCNEFNLPEEILLNFYSTHSTGSVTTEIPDYENYLEYLIDICLVAENIPEKKKTGLLINSLKDKRYLNNYLGTQQEKERIKEEKKQDLDKKHLEQIKALYNQEQQQNLKNFLTEKPDFFNELIEKYCQDNPFVSDLVSRSGKDKNKLLNPMFIAFISKDIEKHPDFNSVSFEQWQKSQPTR